MCLLLHSPFYFVTLQLFQNVFGLRVMPTDDFWSHWNDADWDDDNPKTSVFEHSNFAKVSVPTCLRAQPKILIVVSAGRSGSKVLADTIGALTHSHNLGNELPGSSSSRQKKFFDEGKGLESIIQYLCLKQRENPEDSFIGFKWKPYYLQGDKFAEAWRWLESSNAKVLYSTRNMLDVLISNTMHELHSLPAHCAKNDTSCMTKRINISVALNVKTLQQTLERKKTKRVQVEKLIKVAHGNFFSFDKLFHGSSRLVEWKRLFTYLNQNFTLTQQDVDAAATFSATTSYKQLEKVKNYNEVEQVLQDTEFAELLH